MARWPYNARIVDEHIGAVLVETYRIDRLVGEGGMGRVYEATHLRVPKRFAVKMLNVSMLGNLEALLRFRREAEIVATLDHPSIVTLFDYNVTEEGVPYVVLEFLDGEHLGKRIGRGKLTLSEAMRIIVPVAQALHFAHLREIVHRDLKPENIILLKNEAVKVVDFGIAKIRGGMELTGINTILGTVPYMAPEQLMGGQIDARSDQFALGSIVYELLTGEMAFGASNVPAAAARVAHHFPPPIPDLPGEVNQAVERAMSKQASDRFPSVEAFLRAIVEAASQDQRPAVIIDSSLATDEGLPPLQGEATAITRPGLLHADPDSDDAVADPPEVRKTSITEKTARPADNAIVVEEDPLATQETENVAWADTQPRPVAAPEPSLDRSPDPPRATVATVGRIESYVIPQAEPAPRADDELPREFTAVTMRPPPPTVLSPIIAPPAVEISQEFDKPGALTGTPMGARFWVVLLLAALAGLAAGFWLISQR